MQRDFLSLVREARQDGQTVFLSSHNLYEVEAVADMVAILRHGTLAVIEAVEKRRISSSRERPRTCGPGGFGSFGPFGHTGDRQGWGRAGFGPGRGGRP
ncbi:hypothetical protein Ari01nite_95380 [Paractinoplanes rishiriensis]|uniref:ABC transporter ATP-binding protein n=1 Tax=Paractinoplanes rishiriensis TaxID=1050105 RepID=A0A919K8P0_9ACTN|nr:hypothetical protein Ari01nite_95380 [Actinoplanes rishiriensis]